MKKIITAAAAAAFLFGLATGPALADCKAEVEKTRGKAGYCLKDRQTKVYEILDKAEKRFAQGKIKKCEKLLKKAKKKIDEC